MTVLSGKHLKELLGDPIKTMYAYADPHKYLSFKKKLLNVS